MLVDYSWNYVSTLSLEQRKTYYQKFGQQFELLHQWECNAERDICITEYRAKSNDD